MIHPHYHGRAPLRPRRLVAMLAGGALVVGVALSGPLSAAAYDPADYPSWDDVQAAKSSEASTASEVDRITSLLDGLRAQASRLTDAAIARAGEAQTAAAALAEAQQRVDALEARASSALQEADDAEVQAGRLAAQLYRAGGTDATMNLLVGGRSTDALLYKLGTMSQLTLQTTRLQDAAEATGNTAASLAEQAAAARRERESLAAQSQDALAAAQDAQQAADAQVAEEQSHSDELYAQLALLRNTTAAVERDFADGQAAKASFEQQQRQAQAAAEAEAKRVADAAAAEAAAKPAAAKPAPAAATGGRAPVSAPAPVKAPAAPTAGTPLTLGNDDPSGKDSSGETIAALGTYSGATGGLSPAQAQAYASSVMGSYGWGQDQMDNCLRPLWSGESGWRWNALNRSSGAYGIPQALPASKMASKGADYQTNATTQVDWGLSYISGVYGSPCNAWAKWQARSPHWY